jgi:hypothetical protein
VRRKSLSKLAQAEGRIDEVVRDAARELLKPIYNYINELPALEDAVTTKHGVCSQRTTAVGSGVSFAG